MKKKILFTLPNVEGGGTHRVILNLLKHLDRQIFDITFVAPMNRGEFRNLIPSDIKTIFLNVHWLPNGYWGLLKTIRTIRPDVILSATGHLNLMVLSMRPFIRPKTKIIIRESTNLTSLFADNAYRWSPTIMRLLFSGLYSSADRIVCQSDFMAKDLICNFGISPSKLAKIHNPVDLAEIDRLARKDMNPYLEYGKGPHIVSAGRLTYAKNFQLLIEIFSSFHKREKSARLWILGDGYLRRDLEMQIMNLNLTDSVFLPGFQQNPFPWFYNADLFVLSSRYEGLPNVLLEAMACGCPVLAHDCEGGTGEIMRLTNNENRLRPLKHFVIDESVIGMPNHPDTIKSIESRFNLSGIIESYQRLINTVNVQTA